MSKAGWFRRLKTGVALVGILSAAGCFAQSLDADGRRPAWPPAAPDVWSSRMPPDQLPAAPEIDVRGYRFRGDTVAPGEAWQTPDGQEAYRFRPLSEQEKARLEQTPEWRNR